MRHVSHMVTSCYVTATHHSYNAVYISAEQSHPEEDYATCLEFCFVGVFNDIVHHCWICTIYYISGANRILDFASYFILHLHTIILTNF